MIVEKTFALNAVQLGCIVPAGVMRFVVLVVCRTSTSAKKRGAMGDAVTTAKAILIV